MSASRIPPVDPHARPGAVRRSLHRISNTKPGRWIGINVASRVDPWLLRKTKGRVATTAYFPLVLLRVRGAKSGVERDVPLVYFTRGEDVILTASSFGRERNPAWYYNLKANPDVTLTAGGYSGRFRAREAGEPERSELFEGSRALYAGYGTYEGLAEDRTIPVMVLSPAG